MTNSGETIRDQFEYSISFPSGFRNVLLWIILIILANIILSIWALGPLTWLIILIGIGFGRLWAWIGHYLSHRLILTPLKVYQDSQRDPHQLNFVLRRLFGGNLNRSFLQLQTKDLDLSSIKKFFLESFKIVIPFLAITFTMGRIFIDLGIGTENGNLAPLILSFLLAFPALGIYFPLTKIIEDARIMLILDDGSVEFGGGRIRRLLDGFFSLTGLVSGYTLVLDNTDELVAGTFQYIGIVIIIVIGAVPVLLPAIYIYYKRHAELVNEFRSIALQLEIYPAKTQAKTLTAEEFKSLVLDREIEDDKSSGSILTKLKSMITGKKQDRVKITSNEVEKFEKYGAWICPNCNTINAIDKTNCEKCSQA